MPRLGFCISFSGNARPLENKIGVIAARFMYLLLYSRESIAKSRCIKNVNRDFGLWHRSLLKVFVVYSVFAKTIKWFLFWPMKNPLDNGEVRRP